MVSLHITSNMILVIYALSTHFVVQNTHYGLFPLYLDATSDLTQRRVNNKDGLHLDVNEYEDFHFTEQVA